MIPVELLWAVLVLAAATLVALFWIEQRRIHDEQDYSAKLRLQLQMDEEQLDDILGPRSAPAHDDLQRGGF